MGCDIHLAVERKREDGHWERVLPPPEAYDPWLVKDAAEDPESWSAGRLPVTWYAGRNYRLFAVLANVRNGYGFAGVPTGSPVQPIADPRGLPEDMSQEVAALQEYMEHDISLGDHSHSWLTVAELQAYDWEQGAITYGVVSLTEFAARMMQHGNALPLSVEKSPYEIWCGSTSGPRIVTLEAAEVIVSMANGGLARPAGEETYVRDSWRTPVAQQCEDWCTRVMPALAKIGPPDQVRIVFGFDS